jgi:Tol biopolymer transport system component
VRLTSWHGPDASPVWSPDGRHIAYLQASEPQLSAYTQNTIALIPSSGGTTQLLAPTLDRDVSQLAFTPDGSALRFVLGDDRAAHLAQVPVAGGAVSRLVDGRRVVTAFDESPNGRLVLNTGTAQRSPPKCTRGTTVRCARSRT